jgi:hypothetical protein
MPADQKILAWMALPAKQNNVLIIGVVPAHRLSAFFPEPRNESGIGAGCS